MQEEELSVSEILSSIRQVLSKEAEALNNRVEKPVTPSLSLDTPVLEEPKVKEPVVLELTPTMRVQSESLLSASTTIKTQAALEKLKQIKTVNPSWDLEKEVKPLLIAWLDAHLPEIVEKVVSQEVKRIIYSK